jgi:DnaJ like chaperone protein
LKTSRSSAGPDEGSGGKPKMTLWTRLSEAARGIGTSVLSLLGGEQKTPEKSVAFTIGMIALSAKMAKADGVATRDEFKAFSEVFHVPEADKPAVQRIFDLAKQDVAGFEAYAERIAEMFDEGVQTLEDVVDGLFHIAKADGAVHHDELAYLQRVAGIFGFSERDFLRIRARHVLIADDPFLVLGLPRNTPIADVKKRYRKLARELHPDKQIANGMPKELVVIASDRLARINAAYQAISRGNTT